MLRFDTSSPSCSNGDLYYYVTVGQNGVTEAGAKTLLSVALFAMAADKPVGVLFDDASVYCYVNTLYVDR